jgi:4-diphosphocytidyl-2-C-methyl-D-erythritol kinase
MLSLTSPAKTNLFLKITGKRPDGFHNLASLFQTIDLSDTLQFALANKDTLTCNDPQVPTGSENLILKAAELFRNKTGLKFGLKVELTKRIPIQSGLGGGSSNAATTLWALNKLCGTMIPTEKLQFWGAEIGSDVPFFFSLGTAYCTGRGELVKDMRPLPQQKLWIIKPQQGLETKVVYGALKLDALEVRNPEQDLQAFMSGRPVYYNDLEQPAFGSMPYLRDLKMYLTVKGFNTVLLSGSGTAFFCIGNQTPPALPEHFIKQASFINRKADSWY